MVHFTCRFFDDHAYEVTDRFTRPRASVAQRYHDDHSSIFRLISRMPPEPREWVRILQLASNQSSTLYSNHPGEIYEAVTRAVLRGDLCIYKLPSLSDALPIDGKNDTGLFFMRGPHPHPATSLTPEPLSSPQAAQQFLENLGVSRETLFHYLQHKDVYHASQEHSSLEEVCKLISKGDILVYKVPLQSPASPPKSSSVVETAKVQPVSLGPHEEAGYSSSSAHKPVDNKTSDEDAANENIQFKRVHKDGHVKDPYTLQADGKPLGAQEGDMPFNLYGLDEPPENHDLLVKQGYPNLNVEWSPGNFTTDYKNFSDIRPDILPPGTNIYRVIDEKSNPAGSYWATELPESKTTWRHNYAVKDSWNDNGYYTEYTVPPGEGLKVWRGVTAGQEYREHDEKNFYLAGGKEQIFVSANTLTVAPKKFTPWTDSRL